MQYSESRLKLLSASCSGHVDALIRNAWDYVRTYLVKTSTNRSEAADMISSKLRQAGKFQATDRTLRLLQVEDYLAFGQDGRCLQVLRAISEEVDIGAGPGCLLTADGNPVSLRFTVTPVNGRLSATGVELR
jgi:hypothetical protein